MTTATNTTAPPVNLAGPLRFIVPSVSQSSEPIMSGTPKPEWVWRWGDQITARLVNPELNISREIPVPRDFVPNAGSHVAEWAAQWIRENMYAPPIGDYLIEVGGVYSCVMRYRVRIRRIWTYTADLVAEPV